MRVEGVDVVVHLVAIRQGKPEQFQRIMVGGTRDLLELAKEGGVKRFVHMSALGTSEETKDLVPYYGAKWEQEQDVQRSGLAVCDLPAEFHLRARRRDPPDLPPAREAGSGDADHRLREAADPADLGRRSSPRTSTRRSTSRRRRTARSSSAGPDVVTWNEFWERLKRTLGMRRPSVHVPVGLMKVNALVTERLPGNIPLTRDLLKMLEAGDNVVTNDDAVQTFQLPLVPLDEQLRRVA